jgi:hypothetical protein
MIFAIDCVCLNFPVLFWSNSWHNATLQTAAYSRSAMQDPNLIYCDDMVQKFITLLCLPVSILGTHLALTVLYQS